MGKAKKLVGVVAAAAVATTSIPFGGLNGAGNCRCNSEITAGSGIYF